MKTFKKNKKGSLKNELKKPKTRRIVEIKRTLHLGRFVFLLGAVESADPGASAAAALEDAIYESESNLIDLRLKIEN